MPGGSWGRTPRSRSREEPPSPAKHARRRVAGPSGSRWVLDPVGAGRHGQDLRDRAGGVPAAGELGDVLGHGVLQPEGTGPHREADQVGQRGLGHRGPEQQGRGVDALGVPLVDDLAGARRAVQHEQRGGVRLGDPGGQVPGAAGPGDVGGQRARSPGQRPGRAGPDRPVAATGLVLGVHEASRGQTRSVGGGGVHRPVRVSRCVGCWRAVGGCTPPAGSPSPPPRSRTPPPGPR